MLPTFGTKLKTPEALVELFKSKPLCREFVSECTACYAAFIKNPNQFRLWQRGSEEFSYTMGNEARERALNEVCSAGLIEKLPPINQVDFGYVPTPRFLDLLLSNQNLKKALFIKDNQELQVKSPQEIAEILRERIYAHAVNSYLRRMTPCFPGNLFPDGNWQNAEARLFFEAAVQRGDFSSHPARKELSEGFSPSESLIRKFFPDIDLKRQHEIATSRYETKRMIEMSAVPTPNCLRETLIAIIKADPELNVQKIHAKLIEQEGYEETSLQRVRNNLKTLSDQGTLIRWRSSRAFGISYQVVKEQS